MSFTSASGGCFCCAFTALRYVSARRGVSIAHRETEEGEGARTPEEADDAYEDEPELGRDEREVEDLRRGEDGPGTRDQHARGRTGRGGTRWDETGRD